MAIKGLSRPVAANYSNNNGTVTYSGAYAADHAVEYSFEAESAEDNDLYADNRVQESAGGRFTSGTLTLTTADIPPALAKKMIGLKTVQRQVGEKQIAEVVADDDQNVPYLGFGIIEEHQVDGATKYLPIVFAKVRFNIPAGAATTRGSTIEWQTSQVTAQVMRSDQADDAYNHPWRFCPEEMCATEEDALDYIEAVLGPIKQEIGTLSVQSAAGTETGDTVITVTPTKDSGNSYVYKAGATVNLPEYDEVCDTSSGGWTAWNGTDEITATNGQQIVVVEVTTTGSKARKAGKATVIAKTE